MADTYSANPSPAPVTSATVPKTASNTQYVLATIGMVLLDIAASLVIIALRPLSDPLLILAGVSGVFAPTTLSLLSFLKAQETHLSVNSRLDGFMIEHGAAQRAEGVVEGQKSEQAREKTVNTA